MFKSIIVYALGKFHKSLPHDYFTKNFTLWYIQHCLEAQATLITARYGKYIKCFKLEYLLLFETA